MKPQVSTVFMQVGPGEHIETVDSFESYRGHTKRCPLTCTNRLRGHGAGTAPLRQRATTS